jgi:CheY-like chemotaxis protein
MPSSTLRPCNSSSSGRKLNSTRLPLRGYNGTTDIALTGELAVTKAKDRLLGSSCCKAYQLVFMDIEMPGMNGYEAYQAIKTMYSSAGLSAAFVACSGYSSEKERTKA